ncbi:hypothetical protein D3C81_1256780 [compost metagenome]
MGQGMNVAFDIRLALKLCAHALHRIGQVRQLTALVVRQRSALAFADRLRIAGQPAQGAGQPPRQRSADQQAHADQPQPQAKQTLFGTVDVRLQ